jgi:hypothetical protein
MDGFPRRLHTYILGQERIRRFCKEDLDSVSRLWRTTARRFPTGHQPLRGPKGIRGAVMMPSLKMLKEACDPRRDVLSGELRDEMFAASLSEVVHENAHPVYQDPALFFPNTYPTERSTSFLREVMGRPRYTGRWVTISGGSRL